MIVLTLGRGVHGFTHDPEIGAYILTHPDLRVPEDTREFAVNASNERFWERPVRRYVDECIAGRSGPRGGDFNMRWIASLVAEVHRILIRGGLFMYPKDTKEPAKAGRLRLVYEANPMAMLIEQAGGRASTGRQRILDLVPKALHERAPLILGSRHEVERLERYHREADAGTTTVTRTFQHVFRREGINAATVEGDSFHKYDRKGMKVAMAEAAKQGNPNFSHFGPDANLLSELEAL